MAETARKADSEATETAAGPRFAGHLDQIEGGFVRGWACDEAAPGTRVVVDVFLADRLLGSATADRLREDLVTAGVGDGRHAFVFTLPPAARTVPPRAIGVFFHGTRQPLVRTEGGAPAVPVAAPAPAPIPDDAARIGGRLDALDRVVGNLRSGLDGLDTELRGARARLEQVGRDHAQVLSAIAGLERHLGGNRINGLGERIAALDAAIAVLRDDSTSTRSRFDVTEKAIADIDAFLFRFDERLRSVGARPKRRGGGLALTLAAIALLLAAGALVVALWPDAGALVGAPFGV